MSFDNTDIRYMRRALELAAMGRGHVSPNPMVGAVIVDPSGRIIGEGYHHHYGGPHAEVCAVDSVADTDRALLGASTIYVTLEPCSHYGKTPPCAKLLIDIGIGRVVVGAGDPNPRVAGRGIAMLRDAGIEVAEGLLAHECCQLNRAFMTAHTMRRPYITLKWARSADGFMDHRRTHGEDAARFSTPESRQLVHWRRACHDAIAVGAGTVLADNPSLDVRYIAGRSPRPVIFDRNKLINGDNCRIYNTAIHITDCGKDCSMELSRTLARLYADDGITSVLVEGGASLLSEFIDAGLYDDVYEEVAPVVLGERGNVKAPQAPGILVEQTKINNNIINHYTAPRNC